MGALRVLPVPVICPRVPLGCLGAPRTLPVACTDPDESTGDVILPQDLVPALWGSMRDTYWQPSV